MSKYREHYKPSRDWSGIFIAAFVVCCWAVVMTFDFWGR